MGDLLMKLSAAHILLAGAAFVGFACAGRRYRWLVRNFPQAFSHVALVNSARNLTQPATGPTEHRREA
jgi:hypothetical protein